jgi:hypothetical protein
LKRRPFWKDDIYFKQVANEEQYMNISSGVRHLAVKDVTSLGGMSESMICLHVASHLEAELGSRKSTPTDAS